jgi:hypothetical protein
MMDGEPFGSIATMEPADAAREATATLARWLEDGIISRIE